MPRLLRAAWATAWTARTNRDSSPFARTREPKCEGSPGATFCRLWFSWVASALASHTDWGHVQRESRVNLNLFVTSGKLLWWAKIAAHQRTRTHVREFRVRRVIIEQRRAAYWFPFVARYLCRSRSAFHGAFTTLVRTLNLAEWSNFYTSTCYCGVFSCLNTTTQNTCFSYAQVNLHYTRTSTSNVIVSPVSADVMNKAGKELDTSIILGMI